MIKGVILRGIGGVLLVLFGILFLLFLPRTGSELATDAIFIGAGVLIVRSAFLNYRKQKMQAQLSLDRYKKNSPNIIEISR